MIFIIDLRRRGKPYDLLAPHRDVDPGLNKNFAAPIVSAVKAMHDAGFVHMDLKGQNIALRIVDGDLVPMVIDVVLSTEAEEASQHACGTPGYRSPEVEGFPSTETTFNNKDADVWSLACVLAEIQNRRPIYLDEDSFVWRSHFRCRHPNGDVWIEQSIATGLCYPKCVPLTGDDTILAHLATWVFRASTPHDRPSAAALLVLAEGFLHHKLNSIKNLPR